MEHSALLGEEVRWCDTVFHAVLTWPAVLLLGNLFAFVMMMQMGTRHFSNPAACNDHDGRVTGCGQPQQQPEREAWEQDNPSSRPDRSASQWHSHGSVECHQEHRVSIHPSSGTEAVAGIGYFGSANVPLCESLDPAIARLGIASLIAAANFTD